MTKPTCSCVEPDPSDEPVVGELVVVPEGELQRALGQLVWGEIFVDEGAVPLGVAAPFDDGRLLLRAFALVGQEVAEGRKGKFHYDVCKVVIQIHQLNQKIRFLIFFTN